MKRFLLTCLFFALLLTQAHAQRGISDSEVRFGNWGPQSGPAAAWGTVTTAIEAYFNYINDQGGIHGRRLTLVSRDDAYDPARTVSAVRELNDREQVFAFVGGVGTANGLAVMPLIKREGIPWVSPATGSVVFAEQSDGLIFSTFTNYVVEASLLTRYAATELGAETIAVFYQNDDYGREGLRGLEEEVARLQAEGVNVVVGDRVSYERGTTGMQVQALRLAGSGADAVLLYSDPSAAAGLLAEFARLDYQPQILATVTLLDPSLIANPGMQGALFSSFLRLPSVILGEGNGDPIADRYFQEVVLQYAPQVARDPFRALAGIAFAQPAVEALRLARPELTREGFLEALRSIDGYSEGLFHNVSFVDGYQGNNSIQLLQVTPQGLRPVSDWLSF
jgi:ABC-type branched-subunit amino acid transport system substrate-binding protein